MLQKILQFIAKEDTFKLFTGPAHPNLYDALGGVPESASLLDIRTILARFFTQISQQSDPATFYYSEAQRMIVVIDNLFTELQREYAHAPRQPRDASDDVVDLYLESLNYFAAGIDDPVLAEHIKYLER